MDNIMNSTFLRVLAVFMVIAAIVTAWLGYRISNKQPLDNIEVVVPSYPQVLARVDIPAGHTLTAEDIEIASTQQQDKRTFSNPQNLIGKVTSLSVAKGAAFKTSHFPMDSLLGQALAAHERAVAIKVNEVIGVGGFIKPGDYVDVLLYLRANRETGEVSSAQVVLTNVKVLAYGALTNETETDQENVLTQPSQGKLGAGNGRTDTKQEKDSRSAILAVNDQDVSKLMLADSTGILRLALRGRLPQATTSTADNQFIRLEDVSQSSAVPLATHSKNTAAPSAATTKKKPFTLSAQRERVIVHRGEQVEIVKVTR
jgi:pilus assembly protein CpaB